MTHDPDHDGDATAIAASVRAGECSASSVIDAALKRIDRHTTNAVVTVCAAEARATAALIDAVVARGDDPGPLAGVPFTVKDTIAVAGVRSTAGSLVLGDNVPEHDAEVVRRLRGAGAILVGRTNCPEFALKPRTDNRIFGTTVHPLDATRSPGGSSGGCAAAVAEGLVAFSIGGDYGGSVRYPASCTGIYGLRPTYRAVPTAGHVPEPGGGTPRARFQTVGPLARSGRDIQLVFDVIADPNARLSLSGVSSSGAGRVGVVRGGWSCTDSVAAAVDAVAAQFSAAGYDVVDIDAGPFLEASAVFDSWRASDDHADLRALVAGREAELTPQIARLLATKARPADNVQTRLDTVERTVAALLGASPLLVLPVSRVGVLAFDATSIAIGGGAPESVDALQILAPSRAISVLGLPALAVPATLDRDGFPVGVQLVGGAGAEHALVAAAATIATFR